VTITVDALPVAVEQKSANANNGGGILETSDDGYEHTVIVSVTGLVDSVGDVPVPGCYARTLTKRMPKQIAGHDWNRPQGKYLWMKELLPGDPELPKTTPQGDPWPADAGALIGRVRLFKGTREGDEAALRWGEYGSDLQLSIGYHAKKAARDPRTGTRYLQDVDLYENSEVLWGSSPISGPLPGPLAVKMLEGIALETKGDDPLTKDPFEGVDVAALHLAADAEIDWEEVEAAAKTAPQDDDLLTEEPAEKTEAGADGDEDKGPTKTETLDPALLAEAAVLTADPETKAAPAQNNNSDFNSKHPRGQRGTPSGGKFVKKDSGSADGNNDGLPDNWMAQLMAVDPRYAANAAKKGRKGRGAGKGKSKGREAQKAAAARAAAAGQTVRAVEMERRDRVEAAFEKARAEEDLRREGYDQALGAESDRRVRAGMQRAETQRRTAWHAATRAKRVSEQQTRRAWEAGQRARRIDAANEKARDSARKATQTKTLAVADPETPHSYFPASDGRACEDCDLSAVLTDVHTDPPSVLAAMAWAEDQAWADDLPALGELEGKEGGADRNRGGAENLRRWYQHSAGIPWGTPGDWAKCVAIASKHMRPDQARGYCQLRHMEATGEPAGPGAHGGKGKTEKKDAGVLLTWNPAAEIGPQAAHLPAPETKQHRIEAEAMPGTLEERREAVRDAMNAALRGDPAPNSTEPVSEDGWQGHVSLMATFQDRAIVQRCEYGNGTTKVETFEVPYEMGPDGTVIVGDPKPVVVQASVVPASDAPEPGDAPDPPVPAPPVVALIEDAGYAIKALSAGETKAGRVLSRANEAEIRSAITHLLAVCGVAGVKVDWPSEQQVADEKDKMRTVEPWRTPDTTSVQAREGKALLNAREIAEGLAMLVPVGGA
jgi:hypothetical protein